MTLSRRFVTMPVMIVYYVQPGDTLSRIARQFGSSVQAIVQANNIWDPNRIFAGQRLLIPVGGGSTSPQPQPQPQPQPAPSDLPWFRIAQQELRRGVHEIAGGRHNARIIDYHASTTLRATSDETAWCSSFVNWCVQRAGWPGTRSAMARSWLNWRSGISINHPRRGAIAILWRESPSSSKGHVAFVHRSDGSRIQLLGGNQGDAVSIRSYRTSRILGYRWPR